MPAPGFLRNVYHPSPKDRAADDQIVEIDARALSKLAADLKGIDRELRKDLLRRVRQAAEPVKKGVQAEASFSTRIPRAVRVRASYARGGAKVKVLVDAKRAPHARPINNAGIGGYFRHPVYADRDVDRFDWTWVAQPAVPFMKRGLARGEAAAVRQIARVYDDVARKAGFTD